MKSSLAAKDPIAMFSFENIMDTFLGDTEDGLLILSTQLRVIYINKNCNDLYKKTTGESLEVQSLFQEIPTLNSRTNISALIRKALKGEVLETGANLCLAANTLCYFKIKVTPVKNANADITGVMVRFTKAEERTWIEKSERNDELFKTLIQNSTDAFF